MRRNENEMKLKRDVKARGIKTDSVIIKKKKKYIYLYIVKITRNRAEYPEYPMGR
jgi:hypothetical protein